MTALVRGVAQGRTVTVGDPHLLPEELTADSLVLAMGETAVTRAIIPRAELGSFGPRSLHRARWSGRETPALAADGNGLLSDGGEDVHLGVAYGAYALLEELGFAFLHPLTPTLPKLLAAPTAPIDCTVAPVEGARAPPPHAASPRAHGAPARLGS